MLRCFDYAVGVNEEGFNFEIRKPGQNILPDFLVFLLMKRELLFGIIVEPFKPAIGSAIMVGEEQTTLRLVKPDRFFKFSHHEVKVLLLVG